MIQVEQIKWIDRVLAQYPRIRSIILIFVTMFRLYDRGMSNSTVLQQKKLAFPKNSDMKHALSLVTDVDDIV